MKLKPFSYKQKRQEKPVKEGRNQKKPKLLRIRVCPFCKTPGGTLIKWQAPHGKETYVHRECIKKYAEGQVIDELTKRMIGAK